MVLLLLATVLVAPPSHAADDAHIKGHVSWEGAPERQQATVSVLRPGGGYWQTVVSSSVDAAGDYDFGGLAAGTYRVCFQPSDTGYLSECYLDALFVEPANDVVLATNEIRTVDAMMDEVPSISGSVTGASGQPLQGIEVIAYCWTCGYELVDQTSTTPDGSYRMASLPPGSYSLGFRDGTGHYLTEFWDDAPSAATSHRFVVGRSDEVVGKDAVLEPAAFISGTVTGPDALPVQGVTVRLYRAADSTYLSDKTASTAADGTYTFPGLRAGDYRVGFSDSAWRYLGEFWNDRSSLEAAETVTVDTGETRSGVDAQLATTGGISGRLTNAEGTGLPGVGVFLYHDWGNGFELTSGGATTAPDGTYRIARLRPGAYRLQFVDSSGDYHREFFDDAPTLATADDVVVAGTDFVTGRDAVLTANGGIAGTVTDGTTPLPGVQVQVYAFTPGWPGSPDWDRLDRNVVTAADGTYAVRGLDPGSYRLRFEDPTETYSELFWGGATHLRKAHNIEVPDSATASGKDIVLTRSGSVTGTVTADGGGPLASVFVSAYEVVDGDLVFDQAVQTDSSGHYVLAGLRSGEYRLLFEDTAGTHVSEIWPDAPDLRTGRSLVVPAGGTVAGADAALAPRGRIRGTVRQPDGALLYNAYAAAYREQDHEWRRVAYDATDASGAYDLGLLPPGIYRLKFGHDDYATEFWSDRADLATGRDLVLGAGDHLTDLDARLAPRGSVSGRVTGPDGTGLPGIEVRSYLAEEGDRRYAYTDQSGGYRITGVDGGVHELTFRDPQGVYLSKRIAGVAVGPGVAVTGRDAGLVVAGGIEGRVTDASGAGLTHARVYRYETTEWGWTYVDDVLTDGTGYYRMSGLAAGRYRLGFTTDGSHAREYYPDAGSLDWAGDVVVDLGHTSRVDATLEDEALLTGRVTDARGQPVGQVRAVVYALTPAGFERWDSSPSGSAGRFAIGDLPAGTYRLGFEPPKELADEFWDDQTTLDSSPDIVVGPGDVVDGLDAVLMPSGGVTGAVTDENGVAAPGVVVVAYELQDDVNEVMDVAASNATGTYRLFLPPGTYRLEFQDPDRVLAGEFWDDAATIGDAPDVEVGSEMVVRDTVLAPGGRVSGTVTGPSGEAVPGHARAYRLVDGHYELFSGVAIGVTGTYVLEGLPSGTYRLQFGDWSRPYVDEYYDDVASLDAATDVVVATGAAVSGMDAELAVEQVANETPPAVVGVAQVGRTLAATGGVWAPSAVGLTYQWLADGSPIPGATEPTYTPTPQVLSQPISVRVTASQMPYTSGVATSAATASVTPGVLVNLARPGIRGLARVGRKLSVSAGRWTPSVRLRYQWCANGKAVAGATRSTFRPTKAQQGQRLTVRVRATAPGYVMKSVTTAATARVRSK